MVLMGQVVLIKVVLPYHYDEDKGELTRYYK
jgi:hypothetical protein